MKQTKTKLLCLLIAALMLLSLAACGKETATEPNVIKLGDRELLYKGACIMEDSSGNDAVVLTLDFTNNGKENASYLWSVDETVMQNGVELEVASIITNYDTFETVVDNQFKEVAPGATLVGNDRCNLQLLSLIHISEPTRPHSVSRMPSSA